MSANDLGAAVDTLDQTLQGIWKSHQPVYTQFEPEFHPISWRDQAAEMPSNVKHFLIQIPIHDKWNIQNYDQIDETGKEEMFFFDLACSYTKAKFLHMHESLASTAIHNSTDPNQEAGLARIERVYSIPIEKWFKDPTFADALIVFQSSGIENVFPEHERLINHDISDEAFQ